MGVKPPQPLDHPVREDGSPGENYEDGKTYKSLVLIMVLGAFSLLNQVLC